MTEEGYMILFCLMVEVIVIPGWCFGMPRLAAVLEQRGWVL